MFVQAMAMPNDDYLNTETMRLRISDIRQPSGADAQPRREPPLRVRPDEAYGKQFVELLESVYDAVFITDTEGRIIKCNARALSFFRYSLGELYRQNVLALISGANENILGTICSTLRDERRVFIEAFCTRKDKSQFPADITVSMLHLSDKAEQLCFFIRNITVRKKTEEALQQAQRELVESAHHAGMAEIATGVLHDVGNILNSINVSVEVMLDRLHTDTLEHLQRINTLVNEQDDVGAFYSSDPRAEKLPRLYEKLTENLIHERDRMQEESRNLLDKVNTIRDIVSMQQQYSKADLFMEEVNLNDVIEDALEILKASINRHSLQIDKEYGPQAVARVQKSKLVHIVVNLLQNARDAVSAVPEDERQVYLETGRNPDCIFIRIADNGEGIPPENLERIFNHGFTTKPSGHGFGLHTCANFMTEMGGNIWAESAGRGKGAAFYLTFPVPDTKENDSDVAEKKPADGVQQPHSRR